MGVLQQLQQELQVVGVVEVLGDGGAGVAPQECTQRGVADELVDGIGKCGGIVGLDEEPVAPVLHQFGNTRHATCNHGQAYGHGFEQHIGNAIAVAVCGDARRLHIDSAPPVALQDLLAYQFSTQLNAVRQLVGVDLHLQAVALLAVANDLAAKQQSAAAQQPAGIDQRIQPLLGAQSSYAQDQRCQAGCFAHTRMKYTVVYPVIHAVYRSIRCDIAQRTAVEFGASHRKACGFEPASQIGRVGKVDVLCMSRNGELDAAEARDQLRNVGGGRNEVGVQVPHAIGTQLASQPARTGKVDKTGAAAARATGQGFEVAQRRARQLGHMTCHKAQRFGPRQLGHLQHGGLHAIHRAVAHCVAGLRQGVDAQGHSQLFEP